MNYLYVINYFEPDEENICQEEFQVFFQQPFTSRYHFSQLDIPFTRSVFIKDRLTILASNSSFTMLLKEVEKLELYSDCFKVIYYKNALTHLDYRTSLSYCSRLSEVIGGDTDLVHPQDIFALTYIEGVYYFGKLEKNNSWHQYEHKPYSYSHSLSIKAARCAINLGNGTHDDLKIIDPCCGVGTVVLEGLAMGLDISGSDINRDVSYKGRLNIEHFGYDPLLITRRDIHDITEHYDLAIIDVPYGVYSHISQEQQLDLINEACHIASNCVAITHVEYDEAFKAMHLSYQHKCYLRKGNFYRYFYVLEREDI